jgi:hypothetical protein
MVSDCLKYLLSKNMVVAVCNCDAIHLAFLMLKLYTHLLAKKYKC